MTGAEDLFVAPDFTLLAINKLRLQLLVALDQRHSEHLQDANDRDRQSVQISLGAIPILSLLVLLGAPIRHLKTF